MSPKKSTVLYSYEYGGGPGPGDLLSNTVWYEVPNAYTLHRTRMCTSENVQVLALGFRVRTHVLYVLALGFRGRTRVLYVLALGFRDLGF